MCSGPEFLFVYKLMDNARIYILDASYGPYTPCAIDRTS